jgi:Ran GTPase-activating protein (RanGAP) involved in mRNA processing and transport
MRDLVKGIGCEFLGNCLTTSSITILKLDHNVFGTEGLAQLTNGLCKNKTLTVLSLAYCGLDDKCAKYLQQVLAFVKSELKLLDLQGNALGNDGVHDLFRVLKVNDTLEEVNLADNQFGEPALDKICEVMLVNKSLGGFDLNFNAIYNAGI